jgi:hypothetical protein
MDPVVKAAVIGFGGSGLVAVVAFLTTLLVTRMQLASARDDRLRDQRATAYFDALAAISYRSAKRDVATGMNPSDQVRLYVTSHPEPEWFALEARLQAFASRGSSALCSKRQSLASELCTHSAFGTELAVMRATTSDARPSCKHGLSPLTLMTGPSS